MDKIVVKHSSIVVNDYNFGDSPKLEYFFSIYDMLTHTYTYKGIEFIEEESKVIVPRGLDVYFLEGLFNANAVIDYAHDKYAKTEPILIKYLPRDDTQKKALRFILGEGEYIHTKNKSQLCVNLNTGAGKTYVAIATIAYTCIKSMVITSSIDWLNQWKNCILEYTDITKDEIYMMSGSASIAKLLNGMKDITKYKIFLASHNTIKSYGDKYGWDKVSELFKLLQIGIKIYDEAHLHFDNMCKIDFHTNTCNTLYLTATPARSDKDEDDIYKLYFKNILAIDLFDAEVDPRTQYVAFHFNSHPTPQEISLCKNQYGLNRMAYINYVVHKPNFHLLLHVLVDMIKKVNGKVLIYIGTNYAIAIVQNWIIDNYPDLRHKVGIYTSIVTENKKDQLDKKIILSTTKSCGAAMDIKGLKMTVVLAEPFKSEVLARQTLGRTRDDNTFYLDMNDDGFFYIKKYYAHKKPIFSKYATKCSEVKLADKELLEKSNSVVLASSKLTMPLYKLDGYIGGKMINPLIKPDA